MFSKVLAGVGLVIVAFLIFVATRPSHFHYERSMVIQASAETIFPHLVDLKRGHEWSPYEKVDPNMKKTFSGPDNAVGSKMDFAGNKDAGAGSIEIVNIIPQKQVDLKLIMTEPMFAENMVTYQLSPESDGTRFTWSMHGENGFIGKLFTLLIDCDKMIGEQFEQGLQNLKTLVETKK